ncbi:microsomal glutathione S-transferase 1-like [Chrysoperla carnea]|uniref:microsomal glutathione S-transferase 1-like n=1 Tax=Chrysoperla carnea TaxID=189513 RepID=UPI001D08F51A|nr:microsomal glutathione S-transferase 1-like [Chrysoperla carnea]
MLLMASLTAFQRLKRKVFANPEDTMVSGAKVALDDPYVERIRRAHYNDIENILLFISIGFLYSLTKPKPVIAVNLFRIFTIARFLHTVVYTIVIIRQPARALCWMTGYTITIFMAIWCIKSNLAP